MMTKNTIQETLEQIAREINDSGEITLTVGEITDEIPITVDLSHIETQCVQAELDGALWSTDGYEVWYM
jgi:hypothetical protein